MQTPQEDPSRIQPKDARQLTENIQLAVKMGATVIEVKAKRPADGLIGFAKSEGITHVIFGQSARTRWDILLHGSILNRFLSEVKGAAIQVIPANEESWKRE